MKKILSALIVGILMLSMTACRSKEPEQTLEEFIDVFYEYNRTLSEEGFADILSAKTLLENGDDVSQILEAAHEHIEFHYGTIISIEFSEPVIEKYGSNKLKYLIEDYAYLEETNAGFKAPELTEAYNVDFSMTITASDGVFDEPSGVLIVLEDGEWKAML